MQLIGQLWYILDRRERLEGAVLLCGMALGALFEAVGVGLVVPFIAVIDDPERVFGWAPAAPLLAVLGIDRAEELPVAVGLALIAAFVVKSAYLIFFYHRLFGYVYAKHVALTRRLMTGYLNAPYTFHLQRNTAEVIKSTSETVQRFTSGFMIAALVLLGEVLVLAALVALLLLAAPLATLGALVVLGLPTALLYRGMRGRLAATGRQAEQSLARMIQWAEQSVGGIKEIKLLDLAPYFIARHGAHTRDFAVSWRAFTFLTNLPRLVIDSLAVTGMIAIALVILAEGGDVPSILPLLGMFAVAAIRLLPSVNRIAGALGQWRFHHAATEVLYGELRAVEGAAGPTAPAPDGPRPPALAFTRALTLEHVSYRYPEAARRAIDDVSLQIGAGQWVAFVGATGAGKTTLVDLILGLLRPEEGRILADGRDVHEHLAAWQRNIGYVPQQIYLIDDTVRRNVAFGLADAEIDDAAVWRALGQAQAEAPVRALPDGLDAMIGERGARLSGGERQRLGIARALYRDPAVLVVDEATANLDSETEAQIAATLAGLRGGKTIVVIAHRLALVRQCDRVFVVDGGRVERSGGFAELLSSDPAFRLLAGGAS